MLFQGGNLILHIVQWVEAHRKNARGSSLIDVSSSLAGRGGGRDFYCDGSCKGHVVSFVGTGPALLRAPVNCMLVQYKSFVLSHNSSSLKSRKERQASTLMYPCRFSGRKHGCFVPERKRKELKMHLCDVFTYVLIVYSSK